MIARLVDGRLGCRVNWIMRCATAAAVSFTLTAAPRLNAQPFDDQPESEAFDGSILDRRDDLTMPGGPISPYLLPGAHVEPRHGSWMESQEPPSTYCSCLTRLGFRHSYTHGRNVGWGRPLVSTSWLNRPYYAGASLGPLWMTRSVAPHVSRDTDLIGNVFWGWDWDHYWGSELAYGYATPELENYLAPDAPRADRLATWNYSLMYYPWGDATYRPFWRLGVGNSKFDYPDDAGVRHDAWLLTLPIGVGIKYPLRRWLAARAELTDYLSVGSNDVATQHNLALVLGVECRFGARPQSYWPWNPSRHHW